ncbi:insulin-like growth factor-binding protein complex acid labile subunit [Culicoides brevitarsis]|uniref:insulin-like growth factor-binding protein complex acid labile subunit n=1 Tax=Culicoides brevitarsis TaxID=469753 RepID=UPI00307C5E09
MTLRMENCGLRVILAGTFNHVTLLKKLYLSGNKLENIEKGMFEGLTTLQVLDLAQNKIKKVATDAFFTLDNLDYLNLATNKLTKLNLTLNEPFGMTIDLRDNADLTEIEYTCDDGQDRCSLLIIDDNTVDLTCDMKHQYMDGVCMLQEIQTTEDSVARVNRKFFETNSGYYHSSVLNTEHFKEIIFINSDLFDLPPVLFEFYNYLEYLNMSDNKIRTLAHDTFENASVLVELDLSHNLIYEVGPNVFVGAKELAVVDLSHNRIENVDKHAFFMLNKLTTLILSSNPLKFIELELRFSFPLVLNVSNCSANVLRVTSNTESYIMPFSSSVVDASNNELTEVDLLKDGPIVSMLLENNFGKLDLSNVTNMRSLTTLSLRNSSSTIIKNEDFTSMSQLESLDLAYTNLKLKYGLFSSESKLRKLDLSGNPGLELNFHKLGMLSELEELLLDDNELQTLATFDLVMLLPQLKQISFLQNDFDCDLLVKTILSLKERHIEVQYPKNDEQEKEKDNVNGIRCNSPSKLQRDYALEQQIDRLERTFLTIYALKRAYL